MRLLLIVVGLILSIDAKCLTVTRGSITSAATSHGTYLYYAPKQEAKSKHLLVVCHGVFSTSETAVDAAKATLRKWIRFAEDYRVYVVAPVFDDRDFAVTRPGALGGYRTLTGRVIGADVFLDEIIDSFRQLASDAPKNFLLFGHSAGAQFANRYLIRHANRVEGAVLSSPAWFAFPDPKKQWPDGMLPRREVRKWKPTNETIRMEVNPQRSEWVKAAQVATLVIVGADDISELKPGSHQNHVSQATLWVSEMKALAQAEGLKSKIEIQVVPGVGHNLGKLSRASAPFLSGQLR